MIFQIVNAVLLCGYYAFIAVGLAFMFQVMKIINLAHGTLAILAACAIWLLADRARVTPFLGVLLVLVPIAAIGGGFQRLPLERSGRGGSCCRS